MVTMLVIVTTATPVVETDEEYLEEEIVNRFADDGAFFGWTRRIKF